MEKDGVKIIQVEKPGEKEWKTIGGGINSFNHKNAGKDNYTPLCFTLVDEKGEVLGGLIGSTYWDWFYIDLLWLQEDKRGLGFGHQLLILAEEEAKKRGAKSVYFDTFSFQAPDFYKDHGYEVFGTLENFPKGHTRYFFTKNF